MNLTVVHYKTKIFKYGGNRKYLYCTVFDHFKRLVIYGFLHNSVTKSRLISSTQNYQDKINRLYHFSSSR